MLLIIERLEAELAAVQAQADSNSAIIAGYQQLLAQCRQTYAQYDARHAYLLTMQQADAETIKQLTKDARRLRRKARALGISLPIAGTAIGAGIVALVLILK
jgi:type II secretory pathway component GspD/PulD (secretin)